MADKQFIFGIVDNEQRELTFRSFDDINELKDYIHDMKGCNIDEIQENCIEVGEQIGI